MSGSAKKPRRRWSEAFKRRVVAEASAPGVSVALVARRYDLNANQVFNWRRCYGADCGLDETFLPVELVASARAPLPACAGAGEIEVMLSAGHRVTIRGAFDEAVVARLLRGLVS